jgi:PAS domain S-box-containing protein
MKDKDKTKEQLINELVGLRQRVTELEASEAERKQAEQALRESEEELRAIFDGVGDGIALIDLTGKVVRVNNRITDIGGYTEEEIVGKRFELLKTFPSQSLAKVLSNFTKLISGQQVPPFEVQVKKRDGEIMNVELRGSLLRQKGKTVGIVGVMRNITERKRAEEALRESEERYRTLFEKSPASITLVDKSGVLIDCNKATEELIGYSKEEIVGEPFPKLLTLDPKDLPQLRENFEKLSKGPEVEPYDLEIIRKDGKRRWINVTNSLLTRDDVVVGFLIISRDITERKRMERLLQALNEAALAIEIALTHEEIFAAVAEEFKKLGSLCMVFPTDESQSRLFTKYLSYETKALQAVEKLVGLQHEDFTIPVETVDPYRRVVREKRTVFIENAEDVVRQVLPESLGRLAGQIVKRLKVLRSIAAPLLVENEVIGVLSVQSDDLTEDDVPAITAFAHQMAAAWHKAQLMQDLQNSLEQLKRTQAQLLQAQKMEAIGQLAAGITHDFNNLLTPISGFAELLLGKAPEGSQQQEYLRQIKAAAERAAALTRQLRLFTRQARGKRRSLQLNNLAGETHSLLEHSLPKEITIELHLASELWAVEAEPSQISQVLMNLCVNACDAMPDGGTLTLKTGNVILDEEYARRILEARPGRYVRLSVSDTGWGMSPEVQARLFEPFFTTKGVGEGTGLGLSVVYGIVKGHDGFIQVYSQKGRGSTFHVYLPAIEAAVEEREVEGLELPSGRETILLVDDEEMVRALGQRVLERCGYTVLMAEDGVQALEMYQAHREEIGLVVLDVVMPEMGGLECLRRLRELDPQVKVLISTGYTANNTAQKLVAGGALGIVEKPFLLQDFAVAVRAALDKV